MAKLSDIHMVVGSDQDRNLKWEHRFPCSVDAEGVFRAEIDTESMQHAMKNFSVEQPCDVEVTSHRYRGGRTAIVIAGKKLGSLKSFIHDFGKKMVEADVAYELRIFYTTVLKVPFVVGRKDGLIYRNGYDDPDREGLRTDWHGDTSGGFEKKGTVSIAGSIAKVKTTTHGDAVFTDYERPDEDELGPNGVKLQAWRFGEFPTNKFGGKPSEMKSVPYTEEAAAFFDNAMMGMATLAYRIEQFFEDDENVAAQIEALGGQGLLPAPQSVPNSVETRYVDPDDDL